MHFFTVAPLWLQHYFGWGQREFSLLLIAVTCGLIVNQVLLFDPMQRAIGLAPLACVGALLGLVSALLWTQVTQASAFALTVLGVAVTANALGFGLALAVVNPILAALAGPHNTGAVLTIGAVSTSLGRVGGPVVLGALYERAPALPYFFAAALCATSASFWLLLSCLQRRDHRNTLMI